MEKNIKDYLPWGLGIFVAVIFVQSLYFKFTNSFETQHIFGTIGTWIRELGLPVLLVCLLRLQSCYDYVAKH